MHKKGQNLSLSGAPYIIAIILFVILIAGAGSIAIDAIKTSTGNTGTITKSEEKANFAASSATYFGYYDSFGVEATKCTVSAVWNRTNGAPIIGAANYTTSGASGCRVNVSGLWTNVNVTSSNVYTTYDYGYNTSYHGVEGVMNFGEQLPTIGLVIGIMLVVVVIVGAFAMFLRGSGGF